MAAEITEANLKRLGKKSTDIIDQVTNEISRSERRLGPWKKKIVKYKQ